MKLSFDTYTIKARLTPALLTALPISFAISVAVSAEKWWEHALWLLLVESGGAMALVQFGRDLGKRKEPTLFEKWGGAPTTRLLRHRDTDISATTKQRYHTKLQELLPELHMPTSEEESKKPQEADEIYTSAVRFLREKTRDQSKYNVLFDELASYGFRRNLYGMKPIGIFLSVFGIILSGLLAVELSSLTIVNIYGLIGSVGSVIILTLWLVVITSDWVRSVADAYAHQLLASLEIV